MSDYIVLVNVLEAYEVSADSPDLAAAIVEGGEGHRLEAIDATVEKVINPPGENGYIDPLSPELRQPWRCDTHRKLIQPGRACLDCLLRRPAVIAKAAGS